MSLWRNNLSCFALALGVIAACSSSGEKDEPSSGSMEPENTAGTSAGMSADGAAGGGTGEAGRTGLAGRAGMAGRAGSAGESRGTSGTGGRGSSAGSAGDNGAAGGAGSGTAGSGPSGSELIWPNEMSRANSDTWLVTNHDAITQLRPRVLVIDLENTMASTASSLVDKHIAALKEASSFHKYKDPSAQPALVYELVKIVQAPKGSGRIDYNSWNTQTFADANLQIKDPANPSGPNLTLCGLFEKGVINEVWCMASSDPKCGETQEYKQVYDANGNRTMRMASVSNGDNISSLGCKVTTRITDFNSGRGAGCHLHAMGHAWERYMDSNAVPQLGKQAKRFLNWDLNTRANAPFSNFYSACNSNAKQLTDCIVWESNIRARSGASASRQFDLADLSGGCGNAHFYANTTGTYSYDATTPDPEVLTSCEHYGMRNGPDGKDLTTPYTNAMTDKYYGRSQRNCPTDQPACDDDCGGHGTTYLYQNFPGPGTTAKSDDDSPMRNWWVYLFY